LKIGRCGSTLFFGIDQETLKGGSAQGNAVAVAKLRVEQLFETRARPAPDPVSKPTL
jgi:hypothetical protein